MRARRALGRLAGARSTEAPPALPYFLSNRNFIPNGSNRLPHFTWNRHMIPKLRRCRILSRKEGSWRLGPQGVSIHVRQWRQFNASSNYRMLCATHCDLGYTIREKPFLLGIHEARVPQPWRPNCRLLSRGAHSSSAGVSSWTSAAARHIPHYGASYV